MDHPSIRVNYYGQQGRVLSGVAFGRTGQQGFTFVELLVVIAIIFTILAIATPSLLSAISQAKTARAVGDIQAIGADVQAFSLSNNRYPDTLAEIGDGNLNDPWGAPYQYLNFAGSQGKGKMRKDRFLVPINSFFDLYSMGPDGQSVSALTSKASQDDIIWANDGAYVGPASDY